MDTQRSFHIGVSICSLFLATMLGSCAGTPAEGTPLPPTAFIPASPTSSIPGTSTPHPTETPVPPATDIPTSTPLVCTPQLTYLDDLTIPDYSVVAPGSLMDKRWLVQNSGNCDWDRSFSLRLISGEDMGMAEMLLYPARAGTQAQIQMDLTAPLTAGWYTSEWRAAAPDGSFFGDQLTITIVVQQP